MGWRNCWCHSEQVAGVETQTCDVKDHNSIRKDRAAKTQTERFRRQVKHSSKPSPIIRWVGNETVKAGAKTSMTLGCGFETQRSPLPTRRSVLEPQAQMLQRHASTIAETLRWLVHPHAWVIRLATEVATSTGSCWISEICIRCTGQRP